MQTSYSQDPVAGSPGQLSSGRPSDIDTRAAEGSVAPGKFVVAGTNEGDATIPTGAWTAQTALGIAMLDPSREVAAYDDNDAMGVIRKGTCWADFEVDTVPSPDTPVFARHTANGAGKLVLGTCRADADTGAAQVAGAYFRRIIGTRAEVELNL